jgi:hypothetical protein
MEITSIGCLKELSAEMQEPPPDVLATAVAA